MCPSSASQGPGRRSGCEDARKRRSRLRHVVPSAGGSRGRLTPPRTWARLPARGSPLTLGQGERWPTANRPQIPPTPAAQERRGYRQPGASGLEHARAGLARPRDWRRSRWNWSQHRDAAVAGVSARRLAGGCPPRGSRQDTPGPQGHRDAANRGGGHPARCALKASRHAPAGGPCRLWGCAHPGAGNPRSLDMGHTADAASLASPDGGRVPHSEATGSARPGREGGHPARCASKTLRMHQLGGRCGPGSLAQSPGGGGGDADPPIGRGNDDTKTARSLQALCIFLPWRGAFRVQVVKKASRAPAELWRESLGAWLVPDPAAGSSCPPPLGLIDPRRLGARAPQRFPYPSLRGGRPPRLGPHTPPRPPLAARPA